LIVHAGYARLTFLDQLGLKATVTVARGLEVDLTMITSKRLGRITIAAVTAMMAAWVAFIVTQMIV